MKTLFCLINLIVGMVSLLFGFEFFEVAAGQPGSLAAGVAAVGIGALCLWLAVQAVAAKDLQPL